MPADCIDGFAGVLLEPARGVPRPRRAGRHVVLRAARPADMLARGIRAPARRARVRRVGRASRPPPRARRVSISATGSSSAGSTTLTTRAATRCCRRARSSGRPSNCSKTPTSRSCAPPTSTTAPRSTIRASSTSRSCGRRRSRATSPTASSTSGVTGARLDRGDRRRRRDAHPAALLEGDRAPDPHRARGRRRLRRGSR